MLLKIKLMNFFTAVNHRVLRLKCQFFGKLLVLSGYQSHLLQNNHPLDYQSLNTSKLKNITPVREQLALLPKIEAHISESLMQLSKNQQMGQSGASSVFSSALSNENEVLISR